MPELEIIIDNKDEDLLINYILQDGNILVPSLFYNKPEHFNIENFESFKMHQNNTRLFFIINYNWLKEPLCLKKVHNKIEGEKYYLMQKNGGPTIDYARNIEFNKNGKRYLSVGFIGYHKYYWSTISKKNEKVSYELLNTYKKIIKFYKTISTKTCIYKRMFWVGSNAKHSLDNDEKFLPFFE